MLYIGNSYQHVLIIVMDVFTLCLYLLQCWYDEPLCIAHHVLTITVCVMLQTCIGCIPFVYKDNRDKVCI